MKAFLKLCEDNPDRIGVALHEYSFNDDLFASVTWGEKPYQAVGYNIFRFQYLHGACDVAGIRRPRIQIKEFGWHERHLAPSQAQTKQQLVEAAEVYSQFPNIEGVALWTAANGWDDLSGKVQDLIPFLEEMYVTKEWEIEAIPPNPEGTNMIKNPCFSEGWTDHPIYPSRAQNPTNWNNDFVNAGELLSFINGVTGSRPEATGTRESTLKLNSMLPEHEQMGGSNPLVDCIEPGPKPASYKMQGVYMVAEERLSQAVNGLEPGAEYMFSIKGKVHYHPDEDSIGEPDDIQVRIEANNANRLYKVADFPDRAVEWTVMEVTGVADSQGIMVVAVVFGNMWPNSRDLFLDSASLIKVGITDPDPDPDKIKFVEYIFPQETDKSTYDKITDEAWADYKRTVGGSVDHAMAALLSPTASAESYAVVWESQYPSQQAAIQKLIEAGVPYELRYLDDDFPVDQALKYRPCDTEWITQYFGERPDYYQQFGLPGHEGIDYGVSDGLPYYAAQDGIVAYVSDRSPSGGPSNYGWHCYIQHNVNGQVFHTVYAHARSNMPVVEGQHVNAGIRENQVVSICTLGFYGRLIQATGIQHGLTDIVLIPCPSLRTKKTHQSSQQKINLIC
jgi:murein DD-endopeptidase MepM/ murein hydrolase activator NlpD